MSNPYVNCTVAECTHHMDNNQCMAASISIYNNEKIAKSDTSDDTECKSFHPKKGIGDTISSLGNSNVTGAIQAMFKSGQQINPEVECFVNSCNYWEGGNRCTANSIQVSGLSPTTSCETDCKTYISK